MEGFGWLSGQGLLEELDSRGWSVALCGMKEATAEVDLGEMNPLGGECKAV